MSGFWHQHPALFIGLMMLLGAAWGLEPHWIYPMVAACLLTSHWKWQRAVWCTLLFCVSWGYLHYRAPIVTLENAVHGTGVFTIESIKKSRSPFYQSLLYTGTFSTFTDDTGRVLESTTCRLYLPLHGHRPSAATPYNLHGTLQQKAERQFLFKPDKCSPWTPLTAKAIPLAEWRYQAKEALQRYLECYIHAPDTRSFLHALITGDIDEQSLKLEFSHLGLQHILAISGFHFALVALLLRGCLQPFCSPRWTTVLLLILLSLYYLFLGDSPSVQRAWIAISLFLVGLLIRRPITPLNALGAGLCIEILLNPLHITHLGFCLSFLCTLSLLLLYPLTHQWLCCLLPSRTFQEVKAMPLLDQHGFIFSAFFRQTLAVTLAINMTSIPVLLFLFHRFPLLSLIYNLFFPLWTSLSLLLLCLSLLLFPLPGIPHLLHALNESWTTTILTLTEHPPAFLDFAIRCPSIPYEGLLLYLLTLLFIGIHAQKKSLRQCLV